VAILGAAFDISSRETDRVCRARFGWRGQEWLALYRYTARRIPARIRSPREIESEPWGCPLVPSQPRIESSHITGLKVQSRQTLIVLCAGETVYIPVSKPFHM
jgi:hypothetical protein